jgi:hypothetical protein
MEVRICPTLLPTIKTYVSKSQFPLSLQGLKQINVFATDNREEKTTMVWPRQEDARGENAEINFGMGTSREAKKRTS